MKKSGKRKQQGKRKFRKFFWWRFLFCLILSGTILSLIAYQYVRQMLPASIDDGSRVYIRSMERFIEQFDRIESALSYMSVSYMGDENATMLFQPETGECYFSEPCASVRIWQNGEEQVYWLHDQDVLERLADAVDGAWDSFRDVPIIYSVYIKDDMFMPGEVFERKKSPLCMVRNEFKEGKRQSGKWIDLSPENTEGWTKICSDFSKEELCVYSTDNSDQSVKEKNADGKQHLDALRMYGSFHAPPAIAFTNTMKTKYPEYFSLYKERYESSMERLEHGAISHEMLQQEGVNSREELIEKRKKSHADVLRNLPKEIFEDESYGHYHLENYLDIQNYNVWIDEEPTVFRDQEWYICHFRYLDPYYTFSMYAVFGFPYILAFWVLPSLLIALFWSITAYLIYSKHYDIETYRVNLTNILAHDLKTPLAVIYGHAENIRAHTHPENNDDYADCIMENASHIDGMIAGVLGLSRLENSVVPAMKEQVNLTALLHDAFLRNEARMEERGLTLQESGTLKIKGNAEMLRQLAENLASNAVQHTAEGGTITVTAVKRKLCISNPYTGELDVKTLCEPFKRGDRARGSQSGSGLGLSIVQQIAVLHRMKLRINTKNNLFTIELKKRRRT